MLLFSTKVFTQNSEIMLDPEWTGSGWVSFVKAVEENTDFKFYYDQNELIKVSLNKIESPVPLVPYIESNLKNYGLNVTADNYQYIFITSGKKIITNLLPDIYPEIKKKENSDQKIQKPVDEYLETKNEHVSKMLIIGNKEDGFKTKKAKISGYIRDQKDSSGIIGAIVRIENSGSGTVTDQQGRYELFVNKGDYSLAIKEINHKEYKVRIRLLSDGISNFYLESSSVNLEGVIVTSDRYDKVQNNRMGFEQISVKNIKEIPLVLGEKDILKVATLLPGIQSIGEGASGFNVRGSPADQNMFYIDNVPVYNTSHFFGFFSVFNSDAISEFELSKSNIPVKYGGRLASIFDISAKEGDNNKFKLQGGISPVTGSILVEGPFKKKKSSYLLGLRSTYSNWILKMIKNPDFNKTKLFFGDGISKLNFNIDKKNKISVFGYYSMDDINFAANTQYYLENQGASATWKRFFNEKNNMDLSAIYSRYHLDIQNFENPSEAYHQNNTLFHKELKLDLNFRSNPKHDIALGANTVLYDIDRGSFGPAGEESNISLIELGKERGLESGIYCGDTWMVSNRISVIAGLRYNNYMYLGPKEVYTYPQDLIKEKENIVDTLYFSDYEAIKKHSGLDYRFAAKYKINPSWSVKASYNMLHQYIFLLSNTIALAPTDKWKLSDYHIDPMVGQQVSLGVYSNIWRKKYEFSVEAYMKKVDKLVEFKDGADLLINEVPEWDVLQGKLDVFGLELMIKKNIGRLNGWLNYTYAKTSVLVTGDDFGEKINFGKPYRSNQDKPHYLNLVLNYKLLRRLSFSGNMVYSTGRPITFPTNIYYQDGIQLVNFTSRNESRIPDYFRIDASIKLEGNLKAKKLIHGTWIASVYNLTGRKNVYNQYFKTENVSVKGYKVSIFAYPVFSLTYNFKFGNYEN